MNQNVLNTDLSGKVCVVTGAGGVLCSHFAKVLARAGAKVALLDLNEEAAKGYANEITAEGFSNDRVSVLVDFAKVMEHTYDVGRTLFAPDQSTALAQADKVTGDRERE